MQYRERHGGVEQDRTLLGKPGSIPLVGAVAAQTPRGTRRLRASLRVAAALLAALPLALLVIAGRLEPSSQGLGTHQQLGLPPCSFRLLVGSRCPSCGMTTSWAYFADGNWQSSVSANMGGFWLALYSLTFAAFAIRTAWTARPPAYAVQRGFGGGLLAIALITLVDWALRLW